MFPYERFKAWQEAHSMAIEVHRATRLWPAEERYGLIIEIRRAARSVPTNIVEGSARRGKGELRHFLDISLGSLADVGYLLRFARDLGMLNDEEWKRLEDHRDRAGKLLWGLYRSLGPRESRRTG